MGKKGSPWAASSRWYYFSILKESHRLFTCLLLHNHKLFCFVEYTAAVFQKFSFRVFTSSLSSIMSFRLVDQQAVVVCQRPCEEAHEYLRRYADESLAEGSRAWDTCEKPWSINMSLKDFEKLKVELKLDNPSRTADLMQPKYQSPLQ